MFSFDFIICCIDNFDFYIFANIVWKIIRCIIQRVLPPTFTNIKFNSMFEYHRIMISIQKRTNIKNKQRLREGSVLAAALLLLLGTK